MGKILSSAFTGCLSKSVMALEAKAIVEEKEKQKSLAHILSRIKGICNIKRTDRRGCFNSLDCSLEDLSRQSKVGGATVHNALVIVVLSNAEKNTH